jgi:single-strand DNA-binding protein
MNNLNSILIEGNIVREPEFRATEKGISFCEFSIAVNRYYKTEDSDIKETAYYDGYKAEDSVVDGETTYFKETSYFSVECWSKLAESVNKLGKKGRGVRVVGRIKQDRWVNADGKLLSKISIVAEHIEFSPNSSARAENNADDKN